MGGQGEDALQDQGSSCNWMPTTPYRPILPKPQPEILMASETLRFGVEETEENRVLINFGTLDREKESRFVYHGAGTGACTSAESHFDHMAPWKGIPCQELLALANVAAGNPLLQEDGNGDGCAVLGEIQRKLNQLNFSVAICTIFTNDKCYGHVKCRPHDRPVWGSLSNN